MGEKEKSEKSEKKEKKEKKEKSEKKENDVKKEKDEKAGNAKPQKDSPNAEFDQRKMFKEGQKNLTPPVADPTRGFYESLLKENPKSKIAIKYIVEYGVFPKEEHIKLVKQYNKLKEAGAYSSASALVKKQLDMKEEQKSKVKVGGK